MRLVCHVKPGYSTLLNRHIAPQAAGALCPDCIGIKAGVNLSETSNPLCEGELGRVGHGLFHDLTGYILAERYARIGKQCGMLASLCREFLINGHSRTLSRCHSIYHHGRTGNCITASIDPLEIGGERKSIHRNPALGELQVGGKAGVGDLSDSGKDGIKGFGSDLIGEGLGRRRPELS